MTPSVTVQVLRLPHAEGIPLPGYATAAAAGLDVRAAIAAEQVVPPGAIAAIPTGFAVAIPEGYEIQLRPRSGLAARHGITLPNSPGTIDADYRGEVVVLLQNLGAEPFVVRRGDRIAQLVLQRVPRIAWEECEALDGTARGAGGLGSTGRD